SPNAAFLVCDQLGGDEDTIVAYSLMDGRLQVQSLNPERSGSMQMLEGTVTAAAWTYTTAAAGPGDTHGRVRVTRVLQGADTMQATEEVSADGTTWTRRAAWTETRVK